MGDFTADKNQISEEKGSIFDSFKFWGHRPKHRDSLSVEIENSPKMTEIEDTKEQTLELSPIETKKQEDSKDQTPELSPIETKAQEDSIDHTPKKKIDSPSSSNVKIHETISGNNIITRGWDGNNMLVFKTRRKNL